LLERGQVTLSKRLFCKIDNARVKLFVHGMEITGSIRDYYPHPGVVERAIYSLDVPPAAFDNQWVNLDYGDVFN
jgi:hypothetical protein